MSHKYDYDLIAIGSGSAGGSAAFVAKRANMKVAVVEEFKDKLGGHCPNYACVPTKAMLKAANIYKMAARGAEFGIEMDNLRFDFKKIAAFRQSVVDQLTGPRIERNLASAGIDLLWGRAEFVSEHELILKTPSSDGARKYSFDHAVIGTGSKEFIPPIEGLADAGYWTSDVAVKAEALPDSIVIIGGGPIGMEFAELFLSFGKRVVILQRDPQILPREDGAIADLVAADITKRGAEIHTNCEIMFAHKLASSKSVRIKTNGKETEVAADEILVATGRRANLDLNLAAAGIEVDEKGRLKLNEYLQTNQAHIWAAGDAAGNWQFTHTAAYEGDLVGRNICHNHEEKTNYDVVPRVTFCDPEVASVGITEAQAKLKNLNYRAQSFRTGGLGRYLIERDFRGMVKIIADAKTMEVLGGHIAGQNAGQLIHEIALAMKAKIPVTTMARMIHAYPTFSEAVAACAENFLE